MQIFEIHFFAKGRKIFSIQRMSIFNNDLCGLQLRALSHNNVRVIQMLNRQTEGKPVVAKDLHMNLYYTLGMTIEI